MKNWSRKKKILIVLLALFLTVQAIQPSKNKSNLNKPNDISKTFQTPDSVLALLKNSCYDCHSDNTIYPWYSNITPVNWWLNLHIEEGKAELNFTAFGDYSKKKMDHGLEGIAETAESNHMPLPSYLLMHTDAKLSVAEKKMIIDWATNSRKLLGQ